ncbi:MAG: hypothetical protein V7750_16500 [Sneathiella sp.]
MRDFLERLTLSFHEAGYSIELKEDMQEFANLRGSTPDHALIVPTFDITKSDQSKSRWLKVTGQNGKPAAFGAFKVFETNDLGPLLKSGEIWYKYPPFKPMDIMCRTNFVKGKCFYRGGMYVYPGHRKSGLPFGLATYAQAIAIEEGIDWIIGQAFQEIIDTGLPWHTYGFETAELQYRSSRYCPLKGILGGRESALYLLTCSREKFVSNVLLANSFMTPGCYKDIAALASEFKEINNPAKRASRTG